MVKLEKRVQEYVLKYNIANDVNVVFSDTKSMVTFLENEKRILSELTEVGNFDLSFEQIDGYLKQLEEVEEMLKDFSSNVTKKYFTEEEMHERIIDILEYYDGDDILDETEVFMELANVDYYITYTKEAKEALKQFGVFEALEIVTDYEMEMYGQATYRVAEPASFANYLWYILCEEYVYETLKLSQYETVGEAYEALF